MEVDRHLDPLVLLQDLRCRSRSTSYKIYIIMKGALIISDLSYLQPIVKNLPIIGGKVYAHTVATAITGFEYAVAGANGTAIGETTYTQTQAKTNVNKLGLLSSSTADAAATAYAQTGNKKAFYSSRNNSISLSISNR